MFYLTKECKQFFELFSKLIELFFANIGEIGNEFDIFELFRTTINKLKKYTSKESKTSLVEDNTLIGYITINDKIL